MNVRVLKQDFKIKRSNLLKVLRFEKWLKSYLPELKSKLSRDYLLHKIKKAPAGEVIEISLDKKIVGFLAWLEEIDGSAYLWLMVVLPSFRKNGIGSLLIDLALEEIEKRYNRIWAKVKNDNQTMLAILLKRGFIIKGLVTENGLPVVFLEKEIKKL